MGRRSIASGPGTRVGSPSPAITTTPHSATSSSSPASIIVVDNNNQQQPQPSSSSSMYVPPVRLISSMGLQLPTTPKGTAKVLKAVKKISYVIITSDLLIPGDGEVIKNGAVVIEDNIIAWVGVDSEIPSKYTDQPHKSHRVPFLMPGLWDCHVHFFAAGDVISKGTQGLTYLCDNQVANGARLGRLCWQSIQMGYTSLRDLAGTGCEMVDPIEEGAIIGPNIYSAGAALSQTAGHGDVFALPVGDALLNLGVAQINPGYSNIQMTCLVDGVDECRRAIRYQIRRGAKCIKVLASGGVMSRDDDPHYAQFSKDELEAIVEESSRMGRAVAAHCHGKPGILAAINAGVTTIEHNSFADEECLDLIKEKGIIVVATASIIAGLLDMDIDDLPPHVAKKVKMIAESHTAMYKMAIAKGVKIALGTDTAPGLPMAQELESAVKAGMTNLEAIKAATATAPLTLGSLAPLSGQIKAGYDADLLGVLENPAEDVKILQNPNNINWVWKGGRLLKGPGVSVWGE